MTASRSCVEAVCRLSTRCHSRLAERQSLTGAAGKRSAPLLVAALQNRWCCAPASLVSAAPAQHQRSTSAGGAKDRRKSEIRNKPANNLDCNRTERTAHRCAADTRNTRNEQARILPRNTRSFTEQSAVPSLFRGEHPAFRVFRGSSTPAIPCVSVCAGLRAERRQLSEVRRNPDEFRARRGRGPVRRGGD